MSCKTRGLFTTKHDISLNYSMIPYKEANGFQEHFDFDHELRQICGSME